MRSNSIKEVPGRSKLRVESSNPVPTGNPNRKLAKVKLISPQEAMKLPNGVGSRALSPISSSKPVLSRRRPREPPRPVLSRLSPDQATRPALGHLSPDATRPVLARHAPEAMARLAPDPTRPVLASLSPDVTRHVLARPAPEAMARLAPDPTRPVLASLSPDATTRPVLASPPPDATRPVLARRDHETPRPVLARRDHEGTRSVLARPPPDVRRLVPARVAELSGRRHIVCGLPSSNTNIRRVRWRANRSRFHPTALEPPSSPRGLQIRSRLDQQQATNPTQGVVEETVVEVADRAKDHHGTKETCQSSSDELVSELLRFRPALIPTWKGRIVDSSMFPEFNCEFLAKPTSSIRRKALRLSKAMPTLLMVELLPTGNTLNDVFSRIPRLSDVEIYLFPNVKETEMEHDHLFETMAIRNAMLKANVNDTELLIFSSNVLDKISQFFIKTQRKTEHFLWGCFRQTRCSQQAPSYQTNGDVDMDLVLQYLPESLAETLIAKAEVITSISTVEMPIEEVSLPPGFKKRNKEVSLPPGFEKILIPPLAKLNIHGTSKTDSGLTGSAGLVRNESGEWVFGYSITRSLSELTAGLLAIHNGLKLLWDVGYRRIRLETTNFEIIEALTTKSSEFCKAKSILGSCKDMILKEWEYGIHYITKEENACAEWLANRVENQPKGFVFYEEPPRRLLNLLEKDMAASKR